MPLILSERNIRWNWSADAVDGAGFAQKIKACDFTIAVLDGSQSDQRVLYEVGLSEGMGKPVLIIVAGKRVGYFARTQFPSVYVKLTEMEALAFHLDAFMSTPHEQIFTREVATTPKYPIVSPTFGIPAQQTYSSLEARIFDTVREVGGSAIVDPKFDKDSYRPDLLIWLTSQDSELFDPAAIEVKQTLSSADVRRVERRLLDFMQSAGVRCGFLLTEKPPLARWRPTSLLIFWLSLDEFICLTRNRQLGEHVRHMRNRAAHGAE